MPKKKAVRQSGAAAEETRELPVENRRSAHLERADVDEKSRLVSVAFSSEEPVERWFGMEILGHDSTEVDLEWFNSGRAPLLLDHDPDKQIGVIESAAIGTDRKARADIRFGKSALAEEVFQDVLDEVRQNVSVGYRIHDTVTTDQEGKPDEVKITRWSPLEISIVSIPADMSVGVGRSKDQPEQKPSSSASKEINQSEKRNITMSDEDKKAPEAKNPDMGDAVEKARKAERGRIREITAIGEKFNCSDQATRAVTDGISIDAFRGIVMDHLGESAEPILARDHEIGMGAKETRTYSVLKAMNAMVAGNWSGAEFERECSDEIAKRTGRKPSGFFVPMEIQRAEIMVAQRDLTVGTPADGGYMVGTELRPAAWIDLLRNRMMVRALGATVLTGLVGNIALPKQTGAATAYWVAEGGAPTEGQQTIGQVPLSPKTLGAYTDYTRQLLQQSSVDVENMVRNDLAGILALGIDLAALHGTGAGNQPTGIANTTGIGSVAIGTNGGAPAWSHVVDLETEVAIDNADVGRLAYLTNAKVRGKLKQTEKASGTAQFIWENGRESGEGMVNGYRAGVTNQVRSDLTKGTGTDLSAAFFGNWADLVIGEWGILDVLVDPYSASTTGSVRVVAFQSVDTAARNAQSFAMIADADTA